VRFELDPAEVRLLREFTSRHIDRIVSPDDSVVQLIAPEGVLEFMLRTVPSADEHHPHAVLARIAVSRPPAMMDLDGLRDLGSIRRVSVVTTGVSFSTPRATPPVSIEGMDFAEGTAADPVFVDPRSARPDVRVVDVGVVLETDADRRVLIHADPVGFRLAVSLDAAGALDRAFGASVRLRPLSGP
jgi:hypothetical protein